ALPIFYTSIYLYSLRFALVLHHDKVMKRKNQVFLQKNIAFDVSYGTGTALTRPIGKNCCFVVDIKCEVRAYGFANKRGIGTVRDRSGRMLSAGTASASLPRHGVCRRCPQRTVLVGLP